MYNCPLKSKSSPYKNYLFVFLAFYQISKYATSTFFINIITFYPSKYATSAFLINDIYFKICHFCVSDTRTYSILWYKKFHFNQILFVFNFIFQK